PVRTDASGLKAFLTASGRRPNGAITDASFRTQARIRFRHPAPAPANGPFSTATFQPQPVDSPLFVRLFRHATDGALGCQPRRGAKAQDQFETRKGGQRLGACDRCDGSDSTFTIRTIV